jgi:NUMOD4 motif/HNH endonuclease
VKRRWQRAIPDLSGEEWRPAVGYDGLYEVSNLGRIKSCTKYIPNLLTGGESARPPKLMKTAVDRGGHHHLSLTKDGVAKNVFLHHVVARAFLGPCPDGYQTLHRDDDKEDNRAEALYYGTVAHNGRDKTKNGKSVWGEKHHAASLTEDQVREIFALKGKMGQGVIARKFGTTVSAVSHIHHGWAWTHITGMPLRRPPALEK